MKNLNKIILLVVCFFGFISVADAWTERVGQYGKIVKKNTTMSITATYYKNHSSSVNIDVKYIPNGSIIRGTRYSDGQYNYAYYYATSRGNSAVYCLDPAAHNDNELTAERFLLDPDASLATRAYDTAVMYIYTSSANYTTKSIAIRVITCMFSFAYRNTALSIYDGYSDAAYALYAGFFGLAINWLENDSTIISAASRLNKANLAYNNTNCIQNVNSLKKSFTTDGDTYNFNDYILESPSGGPNNVGSAKTLVQEALTKAADYAESSSEEVARVKKIEVNKGEILDNGDKSEVSEENEKITFTQTHTFTLTGLSDDGKTSFMVTDISFTSDYASIGADSDPYVTNVKINGVDTYNSDPTAKSTFAYNTNIFDGVSGIDFSKDVTVEITIAVTASSEKIMCKDSKSEYNIYYKFEDSSSESGEYDDYVGVVWYGSDNLSQRFISIEKVGDGDSIEGTVSDEPEKSTGEVNFDVCDCDVLKESCIKSIGEKGTSNTDACKTYTEQCDVDECALQDAVCAYGSGTEQEEACQDFNEVCDVDCLTTVSNYFQCCDESNNEILLTDEKQLSINGPDNPVACFANENLKDAKDEAGNSYKQEDHTYCRVSCKEDYDFYMPTSRQTSSARYFTFGMEINGEKNCYTSKIDREQFNIDIVDAQVAMVDAYSNYLYWKSLYDLSTDAYFKETDKACASTTCGSGDDKHEVSCCTKDWIEYTAVNRYTKYWVAESDKNYDEGTISKISKGTAGASDAEDGHVDGSASASCPSTCNTTDGTDGKRSTLRSDIVKNYNAAIKSLESAQDEYKNLIDEFNKCSNWTNEYVYEPVVNYFYEDQLYDYITDKDIKTTMEPISEEKTSGSTADVWTCEEDLTDKEYSACSGTTHSLKDSSIESLLKLEPYYYCTVDDGCYIDEEYAKVYPNIYVKKTANVAQSWQPKTLFYYIKGTDREVTVLESPSEADQTMEPINNGLAVSMGVERGMYPYYIRITDLGQFYSGSNKDEPGRLVGSGNSVANSSDFADKDKLNTSDNNINYQCTYLVNMGEIDGLTLICDFDNCDGDGCDGICEGPGCEETCAIPGCDYYCIGTGCVYDEGNGSSFFERQVNLGDLFPDGTTSRNWNVDGVEGLASKAAATISEIEELDAGVYDTQPILSVTISPDSAKQIINYNEENESAGGYSNKTLSCYDLAGDPDGVCYSNFITEILDKVSDDGYGVEINSESKLQSNSSYRYVGNASGKTGEYFEAWPNPTPRTVEPQDMIVGPSWK